MKRRAESISERELFRDAIHLFQRIAKDWFIGSMENRNFRSWSWNPISSDGALDWSLVTTITEGFCELQLVYQLDLLLRASSWHNSWQIQYLKTFFLFTNFTFLSFDVTLTRLLRRPLNIRLTQQIESAAKANIISIGQRDMLHLSGKILDIRSSFCQIRSDSIQRNQTVRWAFWTR